MAAPSISKLVDFMAAVTSFEDEQAATRSAVERTAEALHAPFAALVRGEAVVSSIGFPLGRVPDAELVGAGAGEITTLVVPGLGSVRVAIAPLDDEQDSRLLVGRGGDGFTEEELGLLRGMARVLVLAVRLLSGVTALQQRQRLLEQSIGIQRAIARRAPLEGVLEAIAGAARELLGDDVSGLRMIDPEDSASMITLAASGVPPDIRRRIARGPIGEGAGGRAIAEGALVIVENYSSASDALLPFSELCLQSAMAAPVHEGGAIVGSLTVASYRPGRRYSESEQQMLLAFAEHASLALMDAKTLDTMAHQALHDSLTGLPNRRLLLDRLQHALQRRASALAVIFLDLDRFKRVNDTLGHDAGDRLLVELAGRLRDCVRPPDTISRLGGDEFAVLLEDLDGGRNVARVAERIGAAVRRPVLLDGGEVVVTASMGIALAGDSGGDPLRDADTAVYRAKAAGGGTYEFFEPRMRRAVAARLGLEADLQRAIARNEFVLHYQPILDLRSRAMVAVEALLRWRHPARGLLAPAEFIPLAEETGAIVDLGSWVMREACRQLAAWQARFPQDPPLVVNINLSGRQLGQSTLPDEIARAVEEAAIEPKHLMLELTETVLMQNSEAALERLHALEQYGVRVAMDDFGTGYSSLCSLRTLPLDVLKIPRTFIDGIERTLADSAVARASLQLADTFGLDVIAEGIETPAQLRELERIGCRYGQGYFLGRPLPAGRLEAHLASRGNARPTVALRPGH